MSGARDPGGQSRSTRRFKVAGIVLGLLVSTLLSLLTPSVQAWVQHHAWPFAGVTAVLVPLMVWVGWRELAGDEESAADPRATPLHRAKADLAAAVLEQWIVEIDSRRLADPGKLLAVHLTPAHQGVRIEPAEAEPRLSLTTEEEAVAAYEGIPSRRCVILGGPSSGKTSAAVLLTKGLVTKWSAESGDPVPVFISLADWKPGLTGERGRKGLIDWLSEKLLEEYPGLRNKSRYGKNVPRALLESGQVRLVLDGLDEIGEPGDQERTRDRQAEAIKQIAEVVDRWALRPGTQPGLILTCRAAEYRQAIGWAETDICDARIVEIEPVELPAAAGFVRRRTTLAQWEKWAPVLDRLAPSDPLAIALTTPLMIALALDVYARRDRDPVELLDLPDVGSVEEHLLNGMVARAFPDRFPAGQADPWQGPQARRWLSFLAHRMKRGDLHDIKWWELPELAGRLEHVLAAIAGFLIIGPPVAVGFGIVLDAVWDRRPAVLVALLAGAAFGLSLGWLSGRSMPPPAEMYFGKTRRLGAILVSGGLVGLIGAGAGFLVFGTVRGMFEVAALGVPIAAAYAGASTDATVRAASPRRLLRNDITVAVVFGLAYGVPIAFVTTLALEAPVLGVLFGVFCGLAGGLTYGLPWLVTLRTGKVGVIAWVHLLLTQLTSRGQIPWKLITFLDEAHKRGVLRQVGPAYQFRHVSLRDVLAEEHRPSPQRRGPVP